VIVTTTGRATLPATLASIKSQRLIEGDEILLVHDGEPGAATVATWDEANLPGQMVVLATGPHNDWGAAARTAGQSMATGTHILWQDDDDWYLPGAFDVIRREIVTATDEILLFRLVYPDGRVLWKDAEIVRKNVSTQMYVVPRTTRLGTWSPQYWGDFDFLQSTVNANPGRPVCFVDKPIVMYSR
jgi:glycosyltransferase involved in cell wall biosynthesis